MTVSFVDLTLYAGALFVLFLTPGPVWVALIARAMTGGMQSAWPLALGVVIGDVIWPLLAIFGITVITGLYSDILTYLRYAAALIFLAMGWALIRNAGAALGEDSRLTRPGIWAGFLAGLLVIMSNPKAIIFYMGILPGFFDLSAMTPTDIAAICLLSALVPFLGNLILAAFVHQARKLLASDAARRRLNLSSGVLLILVGLVIPFT